MIINHNMNAQNAHRMMMGNTVNAGKSMEKLSSGLRINKAGDDAAGLAISEKMRGQIRGLDQASRNSQDGISLIQTAEGALNETHSILQRMRELAVQSATDTNTSDDRSKIQGEVDQLAKEITRISNTTEFNTQNLMAGGLNNTFQIGANKDQNVNLTIGAMDASSLGVAGQVVSQGATTAVGGVSTTTRVGTGLTAQTYKLATTATAATTAANATTAAGTTGGANTIGTIGGAYTGSADAQLRIKIDSIDGSDIPTAVSVSFDGGTTFGSSTAYSAGMNVGNGLTWTAGAGTYVAGNTVSTTFTAASYTLQLKTAGGADVGSAVTVNNAQTAATIGDSTIDATMDVSFTAGGISTAAAADFQVVSTASSTAAVTSNGVVTQAADTKAGISVASQGSANSAIETIDNAIKTVSEERSKLGAYQNRLEHTIANLGTSSENLTAAESRIRDVDMAKEMMNFSKNNILSQAAQAMLAQANSQPQGVLQLLR
ncbi:flagellin [Peptoclostridium acidaminophilum DSM 3953]|uniref:Flagellin n=1 Tax=Peptoclostridium acidaminophilum DSM 3953 TaxID=1286171 RepID=W8TCV7_PEPAC|nr:flagellin [Peptoclostridium acidaminophilum]AHM55623.1 flagellin [Peptoclostridium acidaminophilum DSM 3953]